MIPDHPQSAGPADPQLRLTRDLGYSATEIAATVAVTTEGQLSALFAEMDALLKPEAHSRWFNRPRATFGGATPRQLLVAGRVDEVTGMLWAMNEGVPL